MCKSYTMHPASIMIGKDIWICSSRCNHWLWRLIVAGAVVAKDIPINVVVGGVPAKIIKKI